MASIAVFIIEDHQLLRETWASFLAKHDGIFISGHTGNGEDGLKIIQQNMPDVVLLDIRMRPLSGFTVLSALIKINPAIKVIALSLHVNAGNVNKMLAMGAMGYLTKNCSIEELVRAIKEVFNGNKYISDEVKNLLKQEGLVDITGSSPGLPDLM